MDRVRWALRLAALAQGRPLLGTVLVVVLSTSALAQTIKDPIGRARALYNEGRFDQAIAASDTAHAVPAFANSADLIAARAYLERFRATGVADDLTSARERLRRLDAQRLGPRERIEFLVGIGQALFFDEAFGAAADVFSSVLARDGSLPPAQRERVLDWWASALDRDARPRSDLERQGIYQKIRDRMSDELAGHPESASAAYWLAAAARGQGDLQAAWDAAEAGWVRAALSADHGVALRADLDRLVLRGIVPDRARALAQPPEALRQDWERFKERWSK
jgi:tetratricopeptide (TPR) repeat protein